MQSHPLTENPWSVDTNPELGVVPLSHLYNIDRARCAIASIARLVGNSASEPDATGAQPLDAWTVAALLGGVEGLCEHMGRHDGGHAGNGTRMRTRRRSRRPDA